ncbi:hypothetical protein MFIFM68171_09402 [Madurella fahalii]|uniref:Uncharacterized protein n=1 Tax=Madurella fahalii TaxID=1157608 RepID=A0ABQ0GN51_9PEZI
MQRSKPLTSIKKLFPPIHPPLPLTERESRRLLDVINTSFRTQLDKEHGFASDTSKGASSPLLAAANSAANAALSSPASIEHVAGRPTDGHLHAILNNPLFTQANTLSQPEGSITPYEVHKAVFEKAVARGLMTETRAHGFLRLVYSTVKQSATLSLADGLKSTGATLLVLQWLRSSGLERSLSFVSNRPFTQTLLQFMIAEGLEDLVWVWIERLMKAEAASKSEQQAATEASSAALLRLLATAKTHITLELDGAYTTFLKGKAMNKENSLGTRNLLPAWTAIARDTTVNSWQHTKPSVKLFEPFISFTRKSTLPHIMRIRAHLYLYHPTEPSSGLAVQYLSEENTWKDVKPVSRAAPLPQFIQLLASLGVDTVQHLVQTDQVQEATQILDKLKTHLTFTDGKPIFGV